MTHVLYSLVKKNSVRVRERKELGGQEGNESCSSLVRSQMKRFAGFSVRNANNLILAIVHERAYKKKPQESAKT